MDRKERLRVNPFDWQRAFPQVFAEGGFDVVIGNPPYIRIQAMQEWAPTEVEFYKKKYQAASKGNYDIYVVFVEKGLSLLNRSGRLGFILPHKFFNAQYGEPLRRLISAGKHLAKVVHFGDQQVFEGATTYTCLMFLEKSGKDTFGFEKVTDLLAWRTDASGTMGEMDAAKAITAEWNFTAGEEASLVSKIEKIPLRLENIASLFVGLQTDADDVYILEEIRQEGDKVLCFSKSMEKEYWFENDHLKPFLKGSLNIRRYHLSNVTKRLVFPYELRDGKSFLIEAKEYKSRFPLTWQYLEANRPRLTRRNRGKIGSDWHGYVYKKNHTRFGLPKILVPSIATGSCFAEDFEGKYFFVGSGGGGGGGYGIVLNNSEKISPYYLLGLLNSLLASYFLKQNSTPFQGGYFALNRQYIAQLPIRPINFSDPADIDHHILMVSLVEAMLSLHKQAAAARLPQEKERIERQIQATDRQINRLVYELYELTDEEIRMVEGER
jgi:hypothetical protein